MLLILTFSSQWCLNCLISSSCCQSAWLRQINHQTEHEQRKFLFIFRASSEHPPSLLPAWICLHMSPCSDCSQTIFPHCACRLRKQFHLLNQTMKVSGSDGKSPAACSRMLVDVSGTCWQVTSCQVLVLSRV